MPVATPIEVILVARCLNPGCIDPAVTRGLCRSCYQYLFRRSIRRRESFDQYVRAGVMLPATVGGLTVVPHNERMACRRWLDEQVEKGIK